MYSPLRLTLLATALAATYAPDLAAKTHLNDKIERIVVKRQCDLLILANLSAPPWRR